MLKFLVSSNFYFFFLFSMFTGNNGSAIVLRSSVLVASGNYTFTYNKADSGGALKILFQSAVSTCSPLPLKYCSI